MPKKLKNTISWALDKNVSRFDEIRRKYFGKDVKHDLVDVTWVGCDFAPGSVCLEHLLNPPAFI